MAINLIFIARNGIFMLRVDGRKIYYNDKINGLNMLYPTPSKKALQMGGAPTKDEIKEYEMCKTEAELASFCIRDAKKSGARLIKHEVVK
jgi:hypothetical protein